MAQRQHKQQSQTSYPVTVHVGLAKRQHPNKEHPKPNPAPRLTQAALRLVCF